MVMKIILTEEQFKRVLLTEGDYVFYHGGLSPDVTLSDIDVLRSSVRQQKGKGNYGGFYMSPDIGKNSFAVKYQQSNPGSGLHQITLPSDSKVYEYPNGLERVSRSTLQDLIDKGYDFISGKNIFGNPEYILLNKNRATLKLVPSNDMDNDGIPNRLDIDPDGDGDLDI